MFVICLILYVKQNMFEKVSLQEKENSNSRFGVDVGKVIGRTNVRSR